MFSLSRKIKSLYKTVQFKHLSVFGENTKFDENSSCCNNTGQRNNLLIGRDCFIRCIVRIEGSGKVWIGDRTYIGGGAIIGAYQSITIGNDVIIAGQTHIYDNNNHPTEPSKRLEMSRSKNFFGPLWNWNENVSSEPIVIHDNVWIGERCSILKGVTIGEGSIVGCNSVVTKDVPPYTIVAGNPAKVVKHLTPPENNE